jgi:hypothetical protein
MKTKNQIVEILNKFFTPTCIASMNKDGEYSLIDTFEIIADELLQPVIKQLTAGLYQKCAECGNDYAKEVHCRECGNNFPFDATQHKETLPEQQVTDKEIKKYLLDKYKPIIHNNIDLNKHFRKCAFIEMKAMRDGKIKSQNQKQK